MGLLAAEILAKTGRDPSQFFGQLTSELGVTFYERIDVPATAHQKNALKKVGPDQLSIKELEIRSRDANHGAGQWPGLRRNQGRDRNGLVCCKAFRN